MKLFVSRMNIRAMASNSLSADDVQKAKEAMEVLGRLVENARPSSSGARVDPVVDSIGDETKKGLCIVCLYNYRHYIR